MTTFDCPKPLGVNFTHHMVPFCREGGQKLLRCLELTKDWT